MKGSFSFGRRVTAFVTSTSYNGNLGGVSGADLKCQARAAVAGLPGTYRAWILSGTGTQNRWPEDSIFELVTGVQFASSYTNLVTSTTHTPRLALDELGNSIAGAAWTGIGSGQCVNWTSSSHALMGSVGSVNVFDFD